MFCWLRWCVSCKHRRTSMPIESCTQMLLLCTARNFRWRQFFSHFVNFSDNWMRLCRHHLFFSFVFFEWHMTCICHDKIATNAHYFWLVRWKLEMWTAMIIGDWGQPHIDVFGPHCLPQGSFVLPRKAIHVATSAIGRKFRTFWTVNKKKDNFEPQTKLEVSSLLTNIII